MILQIINDKEGSMIKIMTAIFAFSLATGAFALTNSSPALSDIHTNVMQIKSDAPDSSGDTTPGYCNATLIHKNVLITAAHCVRLAYISGMKKIDIEVGQYKYVVRRTDGQTVRIGYAQKYKLSKDVHVELPASLVDKIHRRGEKANIEPTEDMAIIWWNEETPEFNDIAIAEIVSPAEHAAILKNFSQTAFTALTINPFSEPSLDTKRMATLNNFKWSGYVYSKSFSRVEEGDSGAPLFATINGKNKIFAVVKGKASTVFDNWDAYAAINPHVCALAKMLPTFIQISACK
jgi:hypothetical protein